MNNSGLDLFAFDRHAEQMLIFNWSDGSYSTAKQSYRQDKIGFRCAVLEEVASVEVEGLDLDALLEGDDLEENLEIDFPDDREYDTLAGYILDSVGDIPNKGSEVSFKNYKFKVITLDSNRIDKVEVIKQSE